MRYTLYLKIRDYTGGSLVKNPLGKAGDTEDSTLIPGSGRSLGEGKSNPLQYSYLGNPVDKRNLVGRKRVGHNLATKQQLL